MKFRTAGRLAAMLLFALSLASCDYETTPTDIGGAPEQVAETQELLGILDPVLDPLDPVLDPTTTVRATDENGRVRTYELIREPVLNLDLLNLRVSKLIGLDGGEVSLLGHRIVVPSGAVDIPTLFTLTALPTGYVHVDIVALTGSLLGGLIDIGSAGFARPVRLDLNYDRATNVGNPRKLVILRLNPDGMSAMHEALPSTVDRRAERVTVWLDHFSGYCMAQ